jgi:DNA polymerase I-like protein with 3'-5' exonuclease and polymerase domains
MAQELYPDKTEDQIKASKGYKDGGDVDMYTRGKQAVFATLYGGDAGTINKKLSIDKAVAERAFDGLQKRYPGIKAARERIAEDFAALEQHGAIGTGIITYKKPKDYVETFLGFRRWFPLENKIAKALYDLANNVPSHWRKYDFTVHRRDRDQTPAGAVSSALYGAAFQIQASNIRAANNHLIQSPGAMITKDLQRQIWDLQPAGIGEWVVAPINVHDEVLSVTRPDMVPAVTEVVIRVVESYRDRVPLIGMKWITSMTDWAGKKGGAGAEQVHIGPHGVHTSFLAEEEEEEEYVAPMDLEELEEITELPMWANHEDTVAGGYI